MSTERRAAERPTIRINQVGYLPGRPMVATWVSETEPARGFEVRDASGVVVFSGRTQPWRHSDPSSGLAVHRLDFSGLEARGAGFRVIVGEEQSHPFAIADDLYAGLRTDALRFFWLMRSGFAIDDAAAPGYGRPAGHLGRPPNQGDTAVGAWTGPDADRLYPGWRSPGVFDVSGGWYDAGDYGKYVTSAAIAVWQLLSSVELLAGTEVPAAELAAAVRDEARWELDWLLRMQVPEGELAGMAFHRVHGTEWSPLPGWPHEDPTLRVLHRPSTGATLHLAAAAAHGSRLFRGVDPAYADRLLVAARLAHTAATRHPGLIAPDDHAQFGGGPYGDDDLADDRYWAATELWLATGEDQYRDELLASDLHDADAFPDDGFDFDRVAGPARLDLARSGYALPDHAQVCASVRVAADRLLGLQAAQPWGQPYAPTGGWDWGSNGRILNNLVVLASAHLLTGDERFGDAAAGGMDYVFGRNALGQSYVTGYGTDFSRHQRTRQFGHALDPTFPSPPPGALAGGANARPAPDFPYDPRLVGLPSQCCYLDVPTSEVTNDICVRWNAPLVWMATYLTVAAGMSRCQD
ncbi:MAG TPA: glycoside hydrolase family 9 protein [Propionibacteriaceae bacterium]